ncbi:helicase-exonuclease AddAB subunit AddA [Paenibacillus sp. SC116]|uniref:helicase-exonuclease AddAB subunit AddA n=1 Tax=Paenibacillus sp. SC116 TaxID=2968986 RepID=UPI00215AA109|nr:helicase-exonuclease AddAB subunit AddA [Paenibacillus sp. SC116]MCR8845806.1 helicase-exonuclease AddAB subunit AddA [Paenibacillus sp. SC116]
MDQTNKRTKAKAGQPSQQEVEQIAIDLFDFVDQIIEEEQAVQESAEQSESIHQLPFEHEELLSVSEQAALESFVPATALAPKPQDATWTDEQWQAIVDGGRNILVAAAAGSGKTAVLVERIIRKVIDEHKPVHVDELLVATFTKAAAAEMRERIRLALETKLAESPDSEHIHRQLALLNRASITTLHSFCLEVIQRYFQMIGLDPSFRIANETETQVMRQDVLEELFEEKYELEDEGFRRFVDWFSGERNDEAAFRLVQRLYDFSRSHPWPDAWLQHMAASFGAGTVEELSASPWATSIMTDTRLTLNAIAELLRQATQLSGTPGGPEPYQTVLTEEWQMATQLHNRSLQHPWHEMGAFMEQLEFGRLPACRGDRYEKSLQEQVKRLRDQAKARFSQLREELYRRAPEQFLIEMNNMAPLMNTLVHVIQQFGERFEQAKRGKGWLDFSDLEHYCLRILRAPNSTPEHTEPSDAALQYQGQFAEILLDEYQDTNMVQEAIVNLISRQDKGNRFMVGDVKQSIYRFRLADPTLFMNKYDHYVRYDRNDDELDMHSDRERIQEEAVLEKKRSSDFVDQDGSAPKGARIDLARNFRSRVEVVDAVNMLFRQLMNRHVAELSYDRDAELVCGAMYYPELDAQGDTASTSSSDYDYNVQPEFVLIEKGGGAESHTGDEEDALDSEQPPTQEVDPSELETARIEARAIAARIRMMMGDGREQPAQVYDKQLKRMRAISYRDIVILLRATQSWAPLMVEELRLEGIPAYAEFNTGYFQATEVEIIVSLLRVIDNPYQDIPLAGVLRSPIVGLSAESLAQIRLYAKNKPYFDALTLAAGSAGTEPIEWDGEALLAEEDVHRVQHFMSLWERWREEARQGSLSELIWRIYRETGYYEWVGGLAGGTQRQANLRALYDRARQYEGSSVRGLYAFLRFIDRMKETGGDLGTARALGEQEDVVRLMTIHKSKGLEFPVVFIAGMGKMFNQQDLNAAFLMHKQMGFGPKYVDESTRVTYPTLANLAIRRQMKLELLAEELRVLYVALTRPKEKMILIGTVNDATKVISQWGEALDVESLLLPDYLIARARSYIDWIGPALIRHQAASEWRTLAGLPNRNGSCMIDEPSDWKLTLIPASILALTSSLETDNSSVSDKLALLERIAALDEHIEAERSEHEQTIAERLSWRDPYRLAEMLPAKTSVTEMKRLFAQDDLPSSTWVHSSEVDEDIADEDGLPVEKELPEKTGSVSGSADGSDLTYTLHLRRPRFMEQKRLTPAERGTAYHLLMQHLPLNGSMSTDIITQTLIGMQERQIMTATQAEAIEVDSVYAFFESDIGQRLLHADWVQRELPFSYGLTAAEAYTIELSTSGDTGERLRYVATSTFAAKDNSNLLEEETVLVQGVIDCIFQSNDELILLDYKTDRVRSQQGGVEGLAEHYRFQLDLYARAIEQIWKRPVHKQALYFFDAKEARLL